MFKRILSIILFFTLLTSAAFAAGGMQLSAEHIESEAFSGDTSLTTVTIDEAVAYIDELAFHGCEGLETVYCFSDDVVIADNAFDGVSGVTVYCNVMSSMDTYAQGKGYTVKYLNAFEVECDTADAEACICLPITWSVINPMPGREIESTFTYKIFRTGETAPVYTTTTKDLSVTYAPAVGGAYYVEITMENALTTTTLTTDVLNVGNVLYMGTWEQNGNSTSKERIEWTILTVSGNKALVITTKVIDGGSYFNPSWIKYKYTYWSGPNIGCEGTNYKYAAGAEPSSATRFPGTITHNRVPLDKDGTEWGKEADLYYLHVRNWCNSTFYSAAFTDEEKARILTVTNSNPDNPEYKPYKGVASASTSDKVFFLSLDEYNSYMKGTSAVRGVFTTYARTKVNKTNADSNNWWLRTPGRYRVNAIYISAGGTVHYSGSDVGHCLGYRPAMWIKVGS